MSTTGYGIEGWLDFVERGEDAIIGSSKVEAQLTTRSTVAHGNGGCTVVLTVRSTVAFCARGCSSVLVAGFTVVYGY